MEEALFDLMEIWKRPSMLETMIDLLLCAVPIWLAVMIGLFIGWSWKPRWTGILFFGFRSKFQFLWTTIPPYFGARRLWFAITALSAVSVCRTLWATVKGRNGKSSCSVLSIVTNTRCCESTGSSIYNIEREHIVAEDDLRYFLNFLEEKNISMDWQSLMKKSTANMTYEAWSHDPQDGPFVLRSRTVFEDATPELVRDFFWDDEFRQKWDPMMGYCKILEEYSRTGLMIIQWVRKFPFFCSDREYIIGQRIWQDGKAYYCITKGVPYPDVPRRKKPKRVDVYFSSWHIRAVESRKGDGHLSACEVTLIHYEDMGIPKDVAKVGVRHGMWGTVKRVHGGMRAYQNFRGSNSASGRSAVMAGITTKVSVEESSRAAAAGEEDESAEKGSKEVRGRGVEWKWIAVAVTFAVLCVRSTVVSKRRR